MPWSAIIKFSTRYGIMLLCAWLPPTLETAAGSSVVRLATPEYILFPGERRLFAAVGTCAVSFVVAFRKCMCVGICEILTVTAVVPAFSPSVWPLPMWMGVQPCMFGSAKVV